MKYLFLLLALTGCTQPKAEAKKEAAAEAPAQAVETNQPAPPLDVDLSLEAFTNYAKYFKQSPRYPHILLQNGILSSDIFGRYGSNHIFPIKFKNAGRVLAYTNDLGGIIINDEEVLVTLEEWEKIFNTNLPFFKLKYNDGITPLAIVQNRIYKHVYLNTIRELKRFKDLGQAKAYIKFKRGKKISAKTPKSLSYISQCVLPGDNPLATICRSITNSEERRRFAWYFDYTYNSESKIIVNRYFTHRDIPNPYDKLHDLKQAKVLTELLVFDTPEKTRIRMLNLLVLEAQKYDEYLTQYPGNYLYIIFGPYGGSDGFQP